MDVCFRSCSDVCYLKQAMRAMAQQLITITGDTQAVLTSCKSDVYQGFAAHAQQVRLHM
jgi:hypothetical protein